MNWRNTEDRYGTVSRGFHWTIAILIFVVLGIGLIMDDVRGPEKFALFRWHKSFGITVLALAGLRLGWRFANIQPLKMPTHAAWEKFLASAAHFLLYFSMFAMPLSGWLMSSAKGVSVSVFGWFTLPDLIGKDRHLGHLLAEFHVTTAYVLMGLIALHAAGALKHHFIDRDDTLRRMMLWGRIPATLAVMLAGFMLIGKLLLLSPAAPAPGMPPVAASAALPPSPGVTALPAQTGAAIPAATGTPATPAAPVLAIPDGGAVTQWAIDHDKSSLTFETTQNEAPFTGTIAAFDGTIAFDPDRLADSRVSITITMKGITTGNDDRDHSIGGAEWFAADKFPESIFTAESFDRTGDGQYVAHGKLLLKGVAVPVDLPFSLSIENGPDGQKTAKMQAETTLQRLDYGIGTGEWSDPHTVGTAVKVRVLLQAHSKTGS